MKNNGCKKTKGVEKFECHVTLSKILKTNSLENKMLHELKKWGWKRLYIRTQNNQRQTL